MGFDSLKKKQVGKPVILFEDKLGISTGYEGIWSSLLLTAGFAGTVIHRRSSYKSLGNKFKLLTRVGNRKAPGFNPDTRVQLALRQWVDGIIKRSDPGLIICMDPALLFIVNPDWDQATIDKLRGGVYWLQGIPWLISLPISAWHQKKSDKDIAKMNSGFTDKEEWERASVSNSDSEEGGEEDDEDDVDSDRDGGVWLEPVIVPSGQFILLRDMEKANRIYKKKLEGIK